MNCLKWFTVDVEFSIEADALEVLLDKSCGDVRKLELVSVARYEHRSLAVEPFHPATFTVEFRLDEEAFS
jgi:hypothetical protein